MVKKIAFFPALLILLNLFSCKENTSEIDYNPIVRSSKDYVQAEDGIFEILNSFFKGIHDTTVLNTSYNYIDACDVLYYESGDSMQFSYGEVDRYCQDGKFRRGLFMAKFSGQVFDEGVTAHLYTDQLIVDFFPVEATIDIVNLGLNSSNLPEYSVKVTSSSFMNPDTSRVRDIELITDYILEWFQGSATPSTHEDDTYMVSGSSSGISSDNYSFSVIILEPLCNYIDCNWITCGTSQITVADADYPTGVVDYLLEDNCNNLIYFYINNNLFYDVIK